MEYSIIEQLIYSTVRLETEHSIGTGFFYRMNTKKNGDFKPVIVTNRHVLENANNLTITLNRINNEKMDNSIISMSPLKGNVIFHPDSEIDLAVLPVTGLFNKDFELYVTFFDESIIPNQKDLSELSPIEDIIVIGYPNGLWDSINNKPLVRRGITASDYRIDYEGQPKFIIDSAIFPGSSGSPVFLYNRGIYVENQNMLFGEKIRFLGINSGVFIHNLEGNICQSTYPTDLSILSHMPIGLGIIIKANQLKTMEKLLPK